MIKPEHPQDEAKRLATLRSLNLLDTMNDERFDRLTRLAMNIFDVPIALVSLIDANRQWFKSCQGLSATETDRDISFCGHAILGDDTFVIPNALEDERFFDNPLVTGEPHIRFYAGHPISYGDGIKLGTLCLIDVKPRELTERDKMILKDLAKIVEDEIQTLELALIDELTSINNRRGFYFKASQILSLARRQQMSISLVFLDLNEFKPINDRFGHAEGDKALKSFASALKQISRQSDIAARMGGDEFVLLLSDGAQDKVDQVLMRFAQIIEVVNDEQTLGYSITFSYGVVNFDADKHHSLEQLIAEGDELMYQRKQKRKAELYASTRQ